jgi:hypothetical protein
VSFFSKITFIDQSQLYVEELKVKHLKSIFKSLLGDDPDTDVLFFNLNNILKELTKTDPTKLNFIDYFIALINIRCFAIGSKVSVQISDNTTGEIDLFQIVDFLQKINFNKILEPTILEDLTVNYRFPTIQELLKINKQNNNEVYGYFLQSLKIKSEQIIFNNIEETNIVFNKIPPKASTQIINKIKSIIQYFNDVNLLSYSPHFKEMKLYFNFNIKNLCVVLKLLFGDQLLSLYENLFALCKMGNFTPEYIENCTPGEYLLFVKKLEEINKKSNSRQTEQNTEIGEPLDSYNSINPYESDDLPPITSEFS